MKKLMIYLTLGVSLIWLLACGASEPAPQLAAPGQVSLVFFYTDP
jgi:hypothetical protein